MMVVMSRVVQSRIDSFVKSDKQSNLPLRASSSETEAVSQLNELSTPQDVKVLPEKISRSTIQFYFTARAVGRPCSSLVQNVVSDLSSLHEDVSSSDNQFIELLPEITALPRQEVPTNGFLTYQRRPRTAGQKRKSLSPSAVHTGGKNEVSLSPTERAVIPTMGSESHEKMSDLTSSHHALPCSDSSPDQCWKKLFTTKKIQASKHISGQYFLDFGQGDFSFRSCSVCGLIYAPGQPNDEKIHKTFHLSQLQGISFKGWQKERVAKYIDEKGSRIILILPDDPVQEQYKVKEVVTMMECEMGLAPGWLLHSQCKIYLYVSHAKKVVGCLVAEPITKAFRVVLDNSHGGAISPLNCSDITISSTAVGSLKYSDIANDSMPCNPKRGDTATFFPTQAPKDAEKYSPDGCATNSISSPKHAPDSLKFGNIKFSRDISSKNPRKRQLDSDVEDLGGAILCSQVAVPASCGIRGIWVSRAERRKGIASQLLDVLRKTFFVGSVLQPSQCAFSQPTPDGKVFAG